MDKQKQIEEMAYTICDMTSKCLDCSRHECKAKDNAMKLYNAGYRKIPENAVVIDRDENPCMSCPVPTSEREIADCSTICGAIQLGIDWKNQCRVLVRDYNRLEKEYKNLRKETAEKFKKLLKALVAERNCNEDYDWEDVQVDGQIFVECVDEICKKITEGKV